MSWMRDSFEAVNNVHSMEDNILCLASWTTHGDELMGVGPLDVCHNADDSLDLRCGMRSRPDGPVQHLLSSSAEGRASLASKVG